MQDMLRQLDDLATWVKSASSSRDCSVRSIVHATRLTGHPGTERHNTEYLSDGLFPDKGKNRLLSTSPPSECDIRRVLVVCTLFYYLAGALKYPLNFQDSSSGAVPGNPTKMSLPTDCHSEGFIYVPDVCAISCVSRFLIHFSSYSVILLNSSWVVPVLLSHIQFVATPVIRIILLTPRKPPMTFLTTVVFLSADPLHVPRQLLRSFLLPRARPHSRRYSSVRDAIPPQHLIRAFPPVVSLLKTRCVRGRGCVCHG